MHLTQLQEIHTEYENVKMMLTKLLAAVGGKQ